MSLLNAIKKDCEIHVLKFFYSTALRIICSLKTKKNEIIILFTMSYLNINTYTEHQQASATGGILKPVGS